MTPRLMHGPTPYELVVSGEPTAEVGSQSRRWIVWAALEAVAAAIAVLADLLVSCDGCSALSSRSSPTAAIS